MTHNRKIVVEGSAAARGAQQGSQCRNAIQAAPRVLASLPILPERMPMGLRASLVQASTSLLGRLYLRSHRSLLPCGFREGLAAMARAADTSVPLLYGINAFEAESCHLGFTTGCTALALSGALTGNGPRLAYNHDFPPAFEPYLMVRETRPAHGYASLALTYPTLLGAIAGVNDRGLAVALNQGYATDLKRRRPGLFTTWLVQNCLDGCASVAEAAELLRSVPAANGALVTLSDAAGARAVVELSATQSAIREAREASRALVSFNRYGDPAMGAVEIPLGAITTGVGAGIDVHRCNLTRAARFAALETTIERWNDEAILEVLRDHDGADGCGDTICRHGDDLGGETIATALLDPQARTLRVSFGRACRGALSLHRLEPHAARAA